MYSITESLCRTPEADTTWLSLCSTIKSKVKKKTGGREILEPETLRVSVHFSSEKAHVFLQVLKRMSQKSMKVSLYQLTPKTSPSCTNQELCLSCLVLADSSDICLNWEQMCAFIGLVAIAPRDRGG